MDIGAWIGDSLLILDNYTKRIIYSYEISELNIKKIHNTIISNKIDKKKHKILHKGLSNYNGLSYIVNTGNAGIGINRKGNQIIKITTIDDEVKLYNITVGLIKADI